MKRFLIILVLILTIISCQDINNPQPSPTPGLLTVPVGSTPPPKEF